MAEKPFRALRLAVAILKAVAYIGAAFGFIVAFFAAARANPNSYTFVRELLSAGAVAALAIFSWIAGMIIPQLIEVLLAIEKNTRIAQGHQIAGQTPEHQGEDLGWSV